MSTPDTTFPGSMPPVRFTAPARRGRVQPCPSPDLVVADADLARCRVRRPGLSAGDWMGRALSRVDSCPNPSLTSVAVVFGDPADFG